MNRKTVLITGAAKGIGEAIARKFASLEYNVLVNYNTSEKKALSLKEELLEKGYNVDIYKADVSKREEVNNMICYCLKRFDTLDVVINNSGICEYKLFTDITNSDIEKMLSTTVIGTFNVTQEALNKYMINKKNFTKDEALELCDKYVLNSEIKDEIERIYAPRKDNSFGVPVHYILNMGGKIGQEAVEVLINALHSNGRMLRDKYTVLFPSRLRCYGKDLFFEILSVFNINDGGVVVISSSLEIGEKDHYSRDMDVLEKICQVCKMASKETTIIFNLSSEKSGQENYIKNSLSDMSFIEIQDTALQNEMAKKFLIKLANNYNIVETQSLIGLVEADKLYKIFELVDIFKNWHKNYMQTVQFPQYLMFTKDKQEVVKEASKNTGYKELADLIGLDNVKKIANDFINYQKLQKACLVENMKVMHFSRHMCFIGNPGTAKTTVARIIAQIMKEENLLSNGRLIEVGRADIVSKFVGGTAPRVKELFKKAIGNVLFIDEAYSLYDGQDGLYGDEAINTIVQEMENNREDTVVIFAGYKKEMQKFLDKNAGLRSRIAFELEFPNYSDDELIEIAKLYAKKMDVDISQCLDKIRMIVEKNKHNQNFGNGRFIRSLLEKARMKQATRLVNDNLLYTSKMRELLPEDIEVPVIDSNKISIGFHS